MKVNVKINKNIHILLSSPAEPVCRVPAKEPRPPNSDPGSLAAPKAGWAPNREKALGMYGSANCSWLLVGTLVRSDDGPGNKTKYTKVEAPGN